MYQIASKVCMHLTHQALNCSRKSSKYVEQRVFRQLNCLGKYNQSRLLSSANKVFAWGSESEDCVNY